jgi:hypothetical protein
VAGKEVLLCLIGWGCLLLFSSCIRKGKVWGECEAARELLWPVRSTVEVHGPVPKLCYLSCCTAVQVTVLLAVAFSWLVL